MKSIKTKLIINFLLIIFSTIMLLEVLFIIFIQRYFYDSTEALLVNQIKVSANFYDRYFSSSSLVENIYDNVDVFWKQTNAQVQIIDSHGKLLLDSLGVKENDFVETSDVKKALKAQQGRWIGKVSYDSNEVLSVAYPLKSGDKVVGVLRYITSLKEVNKSVRSITIVFTIIGIMVMIISIMLSYFLAKGIINPIKSVTKVAEKMAKGDLTVRTNHKFKEDEIGKLAETLDYMAEEILKRENLKNEFISSVSHELRTPLTAIKGWAITLNNDFTDKEMLKTGFDIIEKETDRLAAMVEELLDFSKLISGKIQFKDEEINLNELLQYINVYFSLRAEREKISFKVEFEENLPNITGDGDRLKQVFINILDNAFKFTEENGAVFFKVYKNDNYINIVIKDNGCGISEEELPKVKEKFYKGKNSKSQNGIGLSICDEIIKYHNGNFKIKSVINQGTEVIVMLPITKNRG
ncbi:sensor histidine kinase [Clostridium fallax]|nr:HAMP domain-containing sensor histidine kinase [Clostridium fallax]